MKEKYEPTKNNANILWTSKKIIIYFYSNFWMNVNNLPKNRTSELISTNPAWNPILDWEIGSIMFKS